MRSLTLAAAAVLALTVPAQARQPGPPEPQTPAQVLKVLAGQRLLGVWAVDCKKPAGPDNSRETIMSENGRPIAVLEEGERWVADIVTARRVSARDTRMHLREREHGVNYHVVYRREGKRQITWSSMDSDGEDLIVRGRFNNGQRGKWHRLCGPRPADLQ